MQIYAADAHRAWRAVGDENRFVARGSQDRYMGPNLRRPVLRCRIVPVDRTQITAPSALYMGRERARDRKHDERTVSAFTFAP
jgi:hypothetical protein